MSESTVPLVAPSAAQLRADAVWVTIANWAEALAAKYGAAELLTPAGSTAGDDVRKIAFAPGRELAPVTQSFRVKHHRVLVKDLRSVARGLAFRRAISPCPWPYAAPYVWQHHDMFQTAGFRLARRSGLPLVLFVDAPQVWEAAKWGVTRPGWGKVVERVGETWQFRHADVVACVSQEVAEAVCDRGAPRERVLVTPCTADARRFAQAEDRRNELSLAGEVVVGWVGSFRPFHQADRLVRAVAEAQGDRDDVTVLMVGDGPTRAECEDLAKRLNVKAIFTGAVPNGEIPGLLKSMDIGTVLSESDREFHYSPLKVKEYLAAGVATVAPAVGEMARTFTDGVDALLYQPTDSSGFTTALGRLIADPDLVRRTGEAGEVLFRKSFTMDTQLEAVEELLGRTRRDGERSSAVAGARYGSPPDPT